MKLILCAVMLTAPMVAGFGGVHVPEPKMTCHECVCAEDPGTEHDPMDRKCCSGYTWDAYCDGISLYQCKEACFDHDRDHDHWELEKLGSFNSAFAVKVPSQGKAGDFCGDLVSGRKACDPGLHCHGLDDHEEEGHEGEEEEKSLGFCHTFEEELKGLFGGGSEMKNLEKRLQIPFAAFADSPNSDADHGADSVGGAFIHIHKRKPGQTELTFDLHFEQNEDIVRSEHFQQQVLSAIAKALNVDPARLSVEEDHEEKEEDHEEEDAGVGRRLLRSSRSNSSGLTFSLSGVAPTVEIAKPSSPNKAKKKADALVKQGVEMLNFDWDKTANDVHTYAASFNSLESIAATVSPDYIALAMEWVSRDLPIAIVTYNDKDLFVGGKPIYGPDMIAEVLGMVFKDTPAAAEMPIYAKNLHEDKRAGKNPHLQAAQKAAAKKYPAVTNDKVVMLIDDTRNNIDQAIPKGYQTVWVNPDRGFRYKNMNASPNAKTNTHQTPQRGRNRRG